MNNLIVLLLFIGCSELNAETPFSVSVEDLIDSSNLVTVVEISEGRLISDGGYRLTGSVEKQIKGNASTASITFNHRKSQFSDEPNKLGGKYLVFLKVDGGIYKTNENGFSVIEIDEIAAGRGDMDLVLRNLNLSSDRVVSGVDGEVFWYPIICTYGSQEICANVFKILEGAFRANKPSSGTPTD